MRYAIVTSGAVTNVIVLRETNAGDFRSMTARWASGTRTAKVSSTGTAKNF